MFVIFTKWLVVLMSNEKRKQMLWELLRLNVISVLNTWGALFPSSWLRLFFFSLKLFFGGLKMFVFDVSSGILREECFLFRWYFSSVQIQKFLFQDCEAMIMVAVFCSVVIRMFWMKGVKKYTYVCIYSRYDFNDELMIF